jgi:serine/threonine protein kinase
MDPRGSKFTLVSKWMENGNINEFIKMHPDANRAQLVSRHFRFEIYDRYAERVPELVDVALGLQYLHSFNFVHGDLKGVC